MKKFYVIRHDSNLNHLNTVQGYYISDNRESFRDIPAFNIVWSDSIEAIDENDALTKIKLKRELGE